MFSGLHAPLKLSLAFSGPAFSFSWEEAVMDPFNIRPFSNPNGLLQFGIWGAENPTEVQVKQNKTKQNKTEKKQKSKNYKGMNKP